MPPQASPPRPSSFNQAVLLWMDELSPYGVLVTDAQSRIQGWNQWLEQNSGLSARQVVGTALFEKFPDIAARRFDDYFHRALKGEVSVLSSVFHKYLLPFPPPTPACGFPHMRQSVRIAPLREHGRIIGVITTIEDVTERDCQNMLLENQHKRDQLLAWALAQLLQAAEPEPLIKPILDKVSENIAADTYLNYLIEDADDHLRPHDSRGLTKEAGEQLALIKLNEVFSGAGAFDALTEAAHKAPGCQQLKADIANSLGLRACIWHPMLAGNRLIGALLFGSHHRSHFEKEEIELTRTISRFIAGALDRARSDKALRLAQQELGQHAAALEQRVQERTAKLQESVAELEAFSFSLAHDVRAPLRHLQAFTEALLDELGAGASAEVRNYAELILNSSHRLDKLTKDILDYGRVAKGPLRLAPVDLNETLRNVISQNPALAHPGVVTIKPPLSPVLGVPNLLQQCFANLLENALKFVPLGVVPRIEIHTELREAGGDIPAPITGFSEQDNPPSSAAGKPAASPTLEGRTRPHWVRIWVEDNGIGISPEFHKKIFGIFERLWNQDEFEGTGIGLAIVSKAIHRMGGNLGVESTSGKGSKFWLQLPAAA